MRVDGLIIAISQDTLERHAENCMESHNQRLRITTRVTRNLDTTKTPSSTSTSNSLPFTKEQLVLLYKIMGKFEISSSSTSYAFAPSGTFKKTISTSSVLHSNTWITDSRAIDHMTKESNVFLSYISCYSNKKVQVANRSLTPISGKVNVSVIPYVSCNLLSINKLTKSQNCSITFFPTHCVF